MNRLFRIGLISWLALSALSLPGMASANPSRDASNPDSCQSCHRGEDAPQMHGLHGGERYGLTNQVATCATCHGTSESSDVHKSEQTDIISFSHKFEMDELSTTLAVQNQACMDCHQSDDLKAAHWTHDPHADALTCASCHQLHPTSDPMRGLSEKAQVAMCVECHSQLDPAQMKRSGGAK